MKKRTNWLIICFAGGCTYQLTGLCHSAVGAEVDGVNLQNFRVYGKNYQKYKMSKQNSVRKAMAWIQDVVVEIPLDDSMIYVFMGTNLDEVKVHYVFNTGNHHTQTVESTQLPYQIYNSQGSLLKRMFLITSSSSSSSLRRTAVLNLTLPTT